MSLSDADYMRQAMALAAQAQLRGEVPVGAIVVLDQRVIAQGSNAQLPLTTPLRMRKSRRCARVAWHWGVIGSPTRRYM
jgi:tRNA(Arg) A34 adenosine deaminase TadA